MASPIRIYIMSFFKHLSLIVIGTFIGMYIGNFVFAQGVEGIDISPEGVPIGSSTESRYHQAYINPAFEGLPNEQKNMTLMYGKLDYISRQVNDLADVCAN